IEPAPSLQGDWTFRDNLFEKVSFDVTPPSAPLDHDYNAYWVWGDNEQDPEWVPGGPLPEYKRLPIGTSYDDPAPHDVNLIAAPDYQSGPFGRFYLPSTALTVNQGDRLAGDAGLFWYTTRTDQTVEGSEPASAGKLNIGLHYIAATGGVPSNTFIPGV